VWDGWVYTTENGFVFNPPFTFVRVGNRAAAVNSGTLSTVLSPFLQDQRQLESQRKAFRNITETIFPKKSGAK